MAREIRPQEYSFLLDFYLSICGLPLNSKKPQRFQLILINQDIDSLYQHRVSAYDGVSDDNQECFIYHSCLTPNQNQSTLLVITQVQTKLSTVNQTSSSSNRYRNLYDMGRRNRLDVIMILFLILSCNFKLLISIGVRICYFLLVL